MRDVPFGGVVERHELAGDTDICGDERADVEDNEQFDGALGEFVVHG